MLAVAHATQCQSDIICESGKRRRSMFILILQEKPEYRNGALVGKNALTSGISECTSMILKDIDHPGTHRNF